MEMSPVSPTGFSTPFNKKLELKNVMLINET